MKNRVLRSIALIMAFSLSLSGIFLSTSYAEGEDSTETVGTSISLSPISKTLQLSPNETYDDTLEVKNDSNHNIEIEVYAAPYSYVYSEEDDLYQLGFSRENNFTQITRWITFKDANGKWGKNPTFNIDAKGKVEVKYRITTPKDVPAGGQYAVIFTHTLTGETAANGIKTEASPGLIVYGRSAEGDLDRSAEIRDMKIEQSISENGTTRDHIFASAKVKNTGNVDFNAVGKLKVEPVFGGDGYETENTKGAGQISVIPETELIISDEWEDTPSFGLFKATWTVTFGDGQTETIEKIIFINPLPLILLTIILLTIITIWTIIVVRKRKERRSRLAV